MIPVLGMPVSEPVRVHLVIAFHQPLCATSDVINDALTRCYEPLVAEIEKARDLRVSLHFGGHLLDFLARFHEDFLFRVKALIKRGQVEILGGPFYDANLALLPEPDIRGQIQMAAEFWESHSGLVPRVLFPPELLWAHETPRLLEDTDLIAAFIGRVQLHLRDGERAPSLGILTRGGHQIAALVLDDALSAALVTQPLEAWLSDVAAQGRRAQHHLVNLWVRAETLGLEPGTARVCVEEHYVARLFHALASSRTLETTLPSDTLQSVRPAVPVSLGLVTQAQLPEGEGMDAFADHTEFVARMPEVSQLYHRMLQLSARLRWVIAEMEDAHQEEAFRGRLATAQRQVYATQVHELYWRGLTPGFADPRLRDAAYQRLEEAERILDELEDEQRGGRAGDEVRAWHGCSDGDLSQKTYLTSQRLGVLLDERRGGELLWLHDRAQGLSLLDVPSRRAEPYLELMSRARPLGAVGSLPLRRGAQPVRASADLPNHVDALLRRGTRSWLTEADASPSAIVSGRVANLFPETLAWSITHNARATNAPCAHLFAAEATTSLMGHSDRRATLRRHVRLDAKAHMMSLSTQVVLDAPEPLLWATEFPIRLGASSLKVYVDGVLALPGVRLLQSGSQVTVQNEAGLALELAMVCEGGDLDLYWEPINVSIRDLSHFRQIQGGVVLVAHVVTAQTAQLTLSLRCSA